MSTPPVTPELLGAPVAIWALVISVLGFLMAIASLGWQIVKHFLDGGRVSIYLNAAVLEPDYMLATVDNGKFEIRNDEAVEAVLKGRALELAQVVVENRGKVAVTVHTPSLSFSGHGKRRHTVTPRMFATESFGAKRAVVEDVVRLEPYGRVTFLMDYWGIMPSILEDAPKGWVDVRGCVQVAGRMRRPQRSSRRLRWRIREGMYTAIPGSPAFTPFAVIWRAIYGRLPERADEPRHQPDSGRALTRGMLRYPLEAAMGQFTLRPDVDAFAEALGAEAQRFGDQNLFVRFNAYDAYAALDRMEGHLTDWTFGLVSFDLRRARDARAAQASVATRDEDSIEHDVPNPDVAAEPTAPGPE